MNTNDKKSVSVPVRTVNLGSTGKPNESALTEEDKEILGGFNVPLGKTGATPSEQSNPPVSLGDRRQHARELALAKAREVKKQKYSKSEPQENQQDEYSTSNNLLDPRDQLDVPLVETQPPPVTPVVPPNTPDYDRNTGDTPSLISPARKRKILQMLRDLSDDEDEPEEPPPKKLKTTDIPIKESFLRNLVADKAVDFGRFVAATTVIALLSGTLKTFTSGNFQNQGSSVRSSDWFRE